MSAGLSLWLGSKKACLAFMILAIVLIKNVLLRGWSKPFKFIYNFNLPSAYVICQCNSGGC